MYEIYKPFRNQLRKLSTIPSLISAFRFVQFLDFDTPLPDNLKPALQLSLHNRYRYGIVQWEFEILIREIVLNCDTRSKIGISSWTEIAKNINAIKRIENDTWGLHSSREDDVLYELVRIAHRQFPWQTGFTQSQYARYSRLYSNEGLRQLIVCDYGMSPIELFQLSLGIAGHFMSNTGLELPVTNQLNKVSPEICERFVDRFSISLQDLKKSYQSHASYDINWAYSFNPLRQTPLVRIDDRMVICPIPMFLLRRVTNELYFDLVKNDDAFSQHFGDAVQSMIGEVARFCDVDNRFSILPERRYGTRKAPKDTADWIISDDTGHLFVECKGARVRFRGISDLREHDYIDSEFHRIRGFALQLYKTLHSALNGEYPHWQPDGKPIHPIVVTLEDWQTFGLHVERLVFEPLKAELQAFGIDPEIIDRHPLSFCAIDDFERALRVASKIGIDTFFNAKLEKDFPRWSMGTFIGQHFAEEAASDSFAFQEQWDLLDPRTK